MIEINKNYNESNLETMAKMPDCFVDLTVTSPPYDGLRTYNGYSFPFEDIAKELFRITKDGGVLVWVISDATVKGNESGTSFKQALYFKELGFNLHDTMIWIKDGGGAVGSNKCYTQNFEYMFVFSKGKINTTNLIYDKPNASFGKDKSGVGRRLVTGEHPAVFPEALANDHILSWSNEHDLIYDPFMGSGTTAKMSILNNRNWIGSEISSEYCDIIEERIRKAREEKRKEKDLTQKTLFGDGM